MALLNRERFGMICTRQSSARVGKHAHICELCVISEQPPKDQLEQLLNSPFSATHIWVSLIIIAFFVLFYVSSWLKDDLEERGMLKKTFGNRNVIFRYAFQIVKNHTDSKIRKKYCTVLSVTFLTALVIIPGSCYMAAKSLYVDSCDNYANYIDYSVNGVVSYKVKGRRSNPVGIYLRTGSLDPCAYQVPNLYHYLSSGDRVKKAKGDSIIYVIRTNVDSAFIGTRESFECKNK